MGFGGNCCHQRIVRRKPTSSGRWTFPGGKSTASYFGARFNLHDGETTFPLSVVAFSRTLLGPKVETVCEGDRTRVRRPSRKPRGCDLFTRPIGHGCIGHGCIGHVTVTLDPTRTHVIIFFLADIFLGALAYRYHCHGRGMQPIKTTHWYNERASSMKILKSGLLVALP